MPATALRFTPSKVRSRRDPQGRDVLADGYKVLVTVAGVEAYTGALDVEVRISPLDNLQSVATARTQWQAQGGVVTVAPGAPARPGIYMARVKAAGAPVSDFSAFECLVVDPNPTLSPGVAYTGATIRVPPPPGAYMIFENRDRGGRVVGHTRIDVETSPCVLGGTTLRFTKTAREAYWDPVSTKSLRWCTKEVATPAGRWWASPGGIVYGNPWPSMGATLPSVSYPAPNGEGTPVPALLGGFADFPPLRSFEVYTQPDDMGVFYALLPPDHRIPANLSGTPQTIIDLAFGRPGPYVDIDLWHMAALAPSAPGGAVRMRYGETGLQLNPSGVVVGWSVIEDWDWRPDGLIAKIVQWRDVPPLCWRGGYRCVDDARLAVTLDLVDWYVPDEQPISLSLVHPDTGKLEHTLAIGAAGTYQILALRADGKPYHGFLEIEVLAVTQNGQWPAAAQAGPPSRLLWRDARGWPIYVNEGRVNVGFPAHQISSGWGIMLRARPYLTNASLNALSSKPDAELIPNASTARFSNSITLTIGLA